MAALTLIACAAACGSSPDEVAPPTDESLAAVKDSAGVDRNALAHAIDTLFDPDVVGETRALLVLHDGDVVAERYGAGYDADTPLVGWSLSKTVTGLAVGILVADGALALDEAAPVARWQRTGDPRGEITLRHLMQMRSGLRHAESREPGYASDSARMLFYDGRDAMAHYAETQPLDHEAGALYNYSTADTQILSDIATGALTDSPDPAQRQAAMRGWLQARLFGPLGADSMVGEYDATGTLIGGALFHADARDWAKIGELIRNRGVVGGVQLVPRSWIAFMAGDNPADGAHGAHLWRNRARQAGRDPILFGGAQPRDTVAALGHKGQFIVVVPSKGLTIVRLGFSDADRQAALYRGIHRLVMMFPDQ